MVATWLQKNHTTVRGATKNTIKSKNKGGAFEVNICGAYDGTGSKKHKQSEASQKRVLADVRNGVLCAWKSEHSKRSPPAVPRAGKQEQQKAKKENVPKAQVDSTNRNREAVRLRLCFFIALSLWTQPALESNRSSTRSVQRWLWGLRDCKPTRFKREIVFSFLWFICVSSKWARLVLIADGNWSNTNVFRQGYK